MNSLADEIVQRIGGEIANDPNVYDDWVSIEVVFKVEPFVVEQQAIQIVEDGEEIGFLLDSSNPAGDLATRLRELTRVDGKKPWVACKITITRSDMNINIMFEYADSKRWDEPLPF